MDESLDAIEAAIASKQEECHKLRAERKYRRNLGDRLANAIKERATNPQGAFTVFSVIAEGRTWEVRIGGR